ncbi:MAG: hypothetical protein A2020_14980 [Lentisphaerae bacterium GWF2_45_14]|nr:MAG: hypothetical protein A2020_14980 [Lentisphaerae bacterium GWF2_45_14]
MNHYDDIVVGSGISGMTMSMLLGRAGRKVLLLEKQHCVGGSMRRFVRNGIPFDTGFHFTGGFGELLSDMLKALGIESSIEPLPLDTSDKNHIYLADSAEMFDLPSGFDAIRQALYKYFPAEKNAINQYFDMEISIRNRTSFMDIDKLNTLDLPELFEDIDENYLSLKEYLDSITACDKLKTILAGFALCYGSPPKITSLANHCRASYGLHRNLTKVKNGGQAFVDAFKKEARNHNIEIRTGTTIKSVENIVRQKASSVTLSDNSCYSIDNCIMCIHPKEILNILPARKVPQQTRETVLNYQESITFFSIFTELKIDYPVKPNLISMLSCADIDTIIDNKSPASAMAVLTGTEEINGSSHSLLCAFETEAPSSGDRWRNTLHRSKDKSYQQYKLKKAEDMIRRIEHILPEFKGKIKLTNTSSVLTFEDYIPPYGSAYGIMHKMNETPLFGRLPIRNFYAAGQNAVLPGLLGAMLSSFITARFILGKNFIVYSKLKTNLR